MSKTRKLELPEPDARDAVHSAVKFGLSLITLDAASVVDFFIKPPLDKRRDGFLKEVAEGLNELHERNLIDIDALEDDEAFHTTLLKTLRAALFTHQKEKREMLRNAVLNSATSKAPDETRQEMFVQWIDEMTAWHVKILALFERGDLPEIDLDSPDWVMNVARHHLANFIETAYPEMRGHSQVYFTVIQDLHRRVLIANKVPEVGIATRLDRQPKLTPLGKEFLAFVRSPINET